MVSPAASIRCKSLNSLITLGAWWRWKHCNGCLFSRVALSIASVLQEIYDEAVLDYVRWQRNYGSSGQSKVLSAVVF
jgi:hypothetical protein